MAWGCWGEGGSLGTRLRGPWPWLGRRLGVAWERALGPGLEAHLGRVSDTLSWWLGVEEGWARGAGAPPACPGDVPLLMGGALGAGESGGEERGRVRPELASPTRTPALWLRAGSAKGGGVWAGAHLELVLGDHVVIGQRVQQREGAVHSHGDLGAVQP